MQGETALRACAGGTKGRTKVRPELPLGGSDGALNAISTAIERWAKIGLCGFRHGVGRAGGPTHRGQKMEMVQSLELHMPASQPLMLSFMPRKLSIGVLSYLAAGRTRRLVVGFISRTSGGFEHRPRYSKPVCAMLLETGRGMGVLRPRRLSEYAPSGALSFLGVVPKLIMRSTTRAGSSARSPIAYVIFRQCYILVTCALQPTENAPNEASDEASTVSHEIALLSGCEVRCHPRQCLHQYVRSSSRPRRSVSASAISAASLSGNFRLPDCRHCWGRRGR